MKNIFDTNEAEPIEVKLLHIFLHLNVYLKRQRKNLKIIKVLNPLILEAEKVI